MDNLLQQIGTVSAQADKMQAAIQKLATENRSLQNRLNKLYRQLAERDQLIEELQEKSALLTQSGNGEFSGDQEELKQKIDAYLHEIDKCLKFFGD